MLKKYAPIVFGTILFLSVALPVHATPSNNKNFTTFSWVEEQLTELNINVINDGLVSLQNLYQNAMDRLDDIELRIDDIELQKDFSAEKSLSKIKPDYFITYNPSDKEIEIINSYQGKIIETR